LHRDLDTQLYSHADKYSDANHVPNRDADGSANGDGDPE